LRLKQFVWTPQAQAAFDNSRQQWQQLQCSHYLISKKHLQWRLMHAKME
jgi:hypothetical protein